MRVAGRRVDATLNLFAPFLPAALVRMRPRLKSLLRTLGKVRDLDLERAALHEFARELPDPDRIALEPFGKRLDGEYERARAGMLRTLDATATQRWLARFNLALMQPSTTRRRRQQPLAVEVAPSLLRKRYKKFRKAARALTEESSVEESHAVRGKVKSLRYATESLGVLYGKPAEQFLGALRRLQNRLGEQQDAHVAQMRLQAFVREARTDFPAETMFLMGRMAERHAVAGARARAGFEDAFQRLHRKRWKRLRRKLDELNTPRDPEPAKTETGDSSDGEGTGA
jgi:triphosphatase